MTAQARFVDPDPALAAACAAVAPGDEEAMVLKGRTVALDLGLPPEYAPKMSTLHQRLKRVLANQDAAPAQTVWI